MVVLHTQTEAHPDKLRLSTLSGAPTKSRRNWAIRAAMAFTSLAWPVDRSCTTRLVMPWRQRSLSSGALTGTLQVPSSLKRSLSACQYTVLAAAPPPMLQAMCIEDIGELSKGIPCYARRWSFRTIDANLGKVLIGALFVQTLTA